ncbi:glycosyl hydrolase [Noviherbaspirillum saxi]|uniref:Glycosyl hydrolase n=1 Tax=Noviherbaspirillum saxi TaxID=2320863 RepID=A0A3A3FK36_9BURK|nr:glycosyl hydrolase [Noviherbaspirillum saxi]
MPAFAFALCIGNACAAGDAFKDPLDVPAPVTRLTTNTQLSAVTQAGSRLVAVGIRGLIITSDDAGETWTQRQSPVSSDLLAVHFPSASHGWTVGHDGVVLHTQDGGKTWARQFDGRQAGKQLVEHFKKLADRGDANATRLLQEMQLNYENGPEQALLDVWFEDEKNGYVCGSFGTLLSTSDGGKTWTSRIEQVDYDALLHFNAIRVSGRNVFVASERGIVFRLDHDKKRFVPSQTGYNGSFFSLAAEGDMVIAAGLRGTAYRSADAGKSWEKLDTGVISTLTSAATAGGGKVLLVSQSGNLLVSDDGGKAFKTFRVPRPTLLSGVVQASRNKAVVVGLTGVQQVTLK